MKDLQNLVQTDGIDLVTFGQRLRHLRRMRGLTLTELGERVDRAPSVLSLIENGRREPKLSLIEQLAMALSVPMTELLSRRLGGCRLSSSVVGTESAAASCSISDSFGSRRPFSSSDRADGARPTRSPSSASVRPRARRMCRRR